MDTFNQLLLEEQIFIVIAIVGSILFFVRALLYFLSKNTGEEAALRALSTMRFGALAAFTGVGGYGASASMLPWPEPITYALVSGAFVFMVLTIFSRPMAIALSAALRKRKELERIKGVNPSSGNNNSDTI